MKNVCVAAAVCLALFSGCRKADEKKPPAISASVVHTARSEPPQSPYFYGLIEEYQTILAEDPNNIAAMIALGNAYFDSGAWREAIRLYERALKIDPQNADVRTDMGTAYRNMGLPQRAIGEYRRALNIEPGHLNAHFNMGIVYAYDLKDHAVAIRLWEELLRLSPNHPYANYIRSTIAAFKKEHSKGGR